MSVHDYQKIKQSVIDQLDSRRQEIERGDMNWFSIKVMLKYSQSGANRGEIRATFQSEQECSVVDRIGTADRTSRGVVR